MATALKTPATVDEYIQRFPPKTQASLQKLRKTIKAAAPKAEEIISYGIVGYKYLGMLIYFAGWENHISVYPAPRQNEKFKKELAKYKGGKGTVQFTLDEPIPFELVKRIVQFRIKDNEGKAAVKSNKPSRSARPVSRSKKPTDEEQVAAYMKNLKQMKTETEAVRTIIKNSNKKLSERIKWNAPSYYYKEDIVTFGPYKNGKVLLVFHHPEIVKINSELLEGDYKDRRLMYLEDMKAVKTNKNEITRIMNELVNAIDKKYN